MHIRSLISGGTAVVPDTHKHTTQQCLALVFGRQFVKLHLHHSADQSYHDAFYGSVIYDIFEKRFLT